MSDDGTDGKTPEGRAGRSVVRVDPPVTRAKKTRLAANRKQRCDVKYTDEELGAALHKCHGLVTGAAKMLGVDSRGLRERVDNDPARFGPIIKAGRERVVDLAERTLVTMMACKDPKVRMDAARFALSSIGKARGYTTRTEVTGADGGDLVLTIRPPTRDE